ncbi:hypothetical protein EJ110_NYTH40424 [Nymphaea thermarum]|nr:hypothetical protein EJ110_NYTH40424 [Nymphaea thermarum]
MYLVEEGDEPLETEVDQPLTIELETIEDPTIPKILLHALDGDEVPHLMRVNGKLRGRPVSVLIDTGSTHNFICEKSARALGCQIQPAFDVVVGDGSTLRCRGASFIQVQVFKGAQRSLRGLFFIILEHHSSNSFIFKSDFTPSQSPTALICHYRPLHFTINVLWRCRSSAVDVSIKSMAFDERNNLTFPGQIVTVVQFLGDKLGEKTGRQDRRIRLIHGQ